MRSSCCTMARSCRNRSHGLVEAAHGRLQAARSYSFLTDDQMPRNATGKILHRELKKKFATEWHGSDRDASRPQRSAADLRPHPDGIPLRGFRGFDRSATDNLNFFAVYLALPALMFLAMSGIPPDQVRQFGFALTFAGGIAVTFAMGFGLSRLRGWAWLTRASNVWTRVTAMWVLWVYPSAF